MNKNTSKLIVSIISNKRLWFHPWIYEIFFVIACNSLQKPMMKSWMDTPYYLCNNKKKHLRCFGDYYVQIILYLTYKLSFQQVHCIHRRWTVLFKNQHATKKTWIPDAHQNIWISNAQREAAATTCSRSTLWRLTKFSQYCFNIHLSCDLVATLIDSHVIAFVNII